MQLLNHKTILLGVTSSIASFKAVSLASKLTQLGAAVDVILTNNATKLVTPCCFEGVTHRKVYTDTFEGCDDLDNLHVSIAKRADLAIIAPCSANMLAKLAIGLADDKLSTTMLAVRCPVLIAPAMNVNMFENPAVQHNLQILRERGYKIIDPESGNLACGVVAKGRMPEPETLIEHILYEAAIPHVLAGKRVVVTAGATREAIDTVRYISNPSTGKMGYACAKAARMAGASVTLITAPTSLSPIPGVLAVPVVSAQQMASAVFKYAPQADIVIMAAAVSDFTPVTTFDHKIHKTEAPLNIEFRHTPDILQALGKNRRDNQFLCGFSMETDNLIERSREKLVRKRLDMIVANDLTQPGCGFAHDTNGVTLITPDGSIQLEVADKLDIAIAIIQQIAERMAR